jgi:hypothetical protein
MNTVVEYLINSLEKIIISSEYVINLTVIQKHNRSTVLSSVTQRSNAAEHIIFVSLNIGFEMGRRRGGSDSEVGFWRVRSCVRALYIIHDFISKAGLAFEAILDQLNICGRPLFR